MGTRTLTIGLVILAVGIALVAAGVYNLKNTTTTISSFTQPAAGEYLSAELVLNDSVVVVRSPASVGGMVPTQDVQSVNSANIGSYAVPSNSTAASSETYIGLRGDFNYVAFSSSQPNTSIIITGSLLGTVTSGLLVLGGIICVVAGIITSAFGALRRKPTKKATNSEEEYYAKREGAAQS
jgi:uncharacterized membrane protein YidH (DUF202 family)